MLATFANFNEKLLHINQSNTHCTNFVKKTSAGHFNPHPRTVVFEIFIFAGACYSHQTSFFNRCANAVGFALYLSLYKSTLWYNNNETIAIEQGSEILQKFMHPNRLQ